MGMPTINDVRLKDVKWLGSPYAAYLYRAFIYYEKNTRWNIDANKLKEVLHFNYTYKTATFVREILIPAIEIIQDKTDFSIVLGNTTRKFRRKLIFTLVFYINHPTIKPTP